MSDFKIGADGRFERTAGGDFVRIDGRESTKQRVLFRLKTMRGEWFLDPTLGPDYKGKFLIRNFSRSAAERDVRNDLAKIETIKTINEVICTQSANQQAVSIRVVYKDIFGEDGVTVEL